MPSSQDARRILLSDQREPSRSLDWVAVEPLRLDGDMRLVDALVAMEAAATDHAVIVDSSASLGLFGLTDLRRMAADLHGLSPDWSVGALARRPLRCSTDDELAEVVERLQRMSAVLVVGDDGSDGLLTSNALLLTLAAIAEPFLVIADIEAAIRTVLDIRIPAHERAGVLADVLGGTVERPAPEGLDVLSMGDYENLIGAKRMWPRFADVYKNRDIVRNKLARVRALRNQLFHFRGALEPEDVDDLKTQRWWFTVAAGRAARARLSIVSPAVSEDVH